MDEKGNGTNSNTYSFASETTALISGLLNSLQGEGRIFL